MGIYLLLYLIFIAAPIGTLTHEAGHVIGARTLHADNANLSLGTGKKVSEFFFQKVRITIYAMFFIGGMVSSDRKNDYKPHEIIIIALCGPLSNGIFSCLLYILYQLFPSNYLLLLLLFNLWIAIINLVPFQFKGKKSDGYTVYKALIQK